MNLNLEGEYKSSCELLKDILTKNARKILEDTLEIQPLEFCVALEESRWYGDEISVYVERTEEDESMEIPLDSSKIKIKNSIPIRTAILKIEPRRHLTKFTLHLEY